jgi:hypothetical protein
MTNTNNLNIPLVVQSQAQKEVTINQAISILEALQNRGVVDKDLSTPPGSPAEGDAYIVAASPTGAWSGKAKNIAYYNGGWKFVAPNEGLIVWVNYEDKIYCYDGANWAIYGDTSSFALLGVNATADSSNKLSVASDAVLLSHNGTDIRTKLNKYASSNTASFLFQDAFSGRAELGLIADDDFTLKTSADGTAWNNSFKASKTDGCVDFLAGVKFSGGTLLNVYEEGTFTPALAGASTPGTAIYSVQSGSYTRFGNRLAFDIRLVVTSLTGSAGGLRITGLPFTIGSVGNGVSIGYYANANLGAGFYGILGWPSLSNTYISLYKQAATTAAALTGTDISGSFDIRLSGICKI